MQKKATLKGFTLIEILVVVGLIAILAAITIVAINPAKNFADTRNTQRSADVQQILNAVVQYTSEPGNTLAAFGTIPLCDATPAPISAVTTGTPPAGTINLYTLLVDEYIAAIPMDPNGGTEANTGYTICQTSGQRVEVAAPGAENGKEIKVRK
ncbi:MAG: type II secretion system protein [Candidatus Dojkabacteria bacterium]|nr:MAG: type II secretion system protein [Candidatus Dojkabacteria bacterium]